MSRNTSSILQLALSILALLSVSACGLTALAVGYFQQNARIPGVSNDISMFLYTAGLVLTAVLLVPSIWHSYRALQGNPAPISAKSQNLISTAGPSFLMLTVFPLALYAGDQIQGSPVAGWILPWLHLLSAGLPVYWLLHTAIRQVGGTSPQRFWGILTSGLLVGPTFILVAELLVVFTAFLVLIMYATANPDLTAQIESLAQRLPLAVDNPARLANLLEPYLRNPILILSVTGFLAVIVPVIEETLKPIGVWFLAGRNLTEAEGFVAGAISGAGYALFESLFIPSTAGSWATIALGRVGTSAMHILASALTGWGLALAWQNGKYLRLALQYLAAIALHSLWNGTTILNIFIQLMPSSSFTYTAARVQPIFLGLLGLLCFTMLFILGRRFASHGQSPTLDAPAVDAEN